LADKASDITDRCLKCGFCVNQCPVYRELKDETVSPRAKLRLIKAYREGALKNDKILRKVLSNCLMCESCHKNCPGGLHTSDAISEMRAEFRTKYGLDWKKKLLKAALGDKRLRKLSAYWARLVYNNLISNIPMPLNMPAGALSLKNIPRLNKALKNMTAGTGRTKKAFFFAGCVDRFMFSDTAKAVIKVLNAAGFDVEISPDERCCGMPLMISGDSASLGKSARINIDLMSAKSYDAIVSGCPTCIVALKQKYAGIIKGDAEYEEKLNKIVPLMSDFTELVANNLSSLPPLKELKSTVTYHDPCHLINSLGISLEPRKLIAAAPGTVFKELPGGASCCGSGGFYHVYFPEIARKIGKKKAENIKSTGAGVTLTACPACKLQLISFTRSASIKTEIRHIAEFLAERL